MDIFGGDIDSYLDEFNENVREEDVGEAIEDDKENNDGEEEDGENKDPIKVEAKKRSVRRPQMRLNVERLKSDRGIHKLENYFKDMKYRGKGYERQDLNEVMKRFSHEQMFFVYVFLFRRNTKVIEFN